MQTLSSLRSALDDRALVDAVFGDHPANDPATAPVEAFTSHGCAVLALALRDLTGRAVAVAWLGEEPLHAALVVEGGYLDADGAATPTMLRARWAAIAGVPAEAVTLRPYDADAARWYEPAMTPDQVAVLARLLDVRVPSLIRALQG
jgi:hypothetical protein